MEKLYYLLTDNGTLGERYFPDSESTSPNTATFPPIAEFALLPDGTISLIHWPRIARSALIPDEIDAHPVTAIAATAFAPSHLDESFFDQFYQSPISYSVFCMRMGQYVTTETIDEGGPTQIHLPKSVHRIGPYAFWHCTNLKELSFPDLIEDLPVGVCGDCCRLQTVHLPQHLKRIGYLPRSTEQVMPDIGAFSGCHALRHLTIPASVTTLGAHTFNSSALQRLTVLDDSPCADWHRSVTVATTAFDHASALLWVEKATPSGQVLCQIGLPAARDKILSADPAFGIILRLPELFFQRPIEWFDQLAQDSFRLDFSAQMALSRSAYPAGLSEKNRQWYFSLLIRYFDRAPQFMSESSPQAYFTLFHFLCQSDLLTAADLSSLLRRAGELSLPADLLAEMISVRTFRFSSIIGFEDLELE